MMSGARLPLPPAAAHRPRGWWRGGASSFGAALNCRLYSPPCGTCLRLAAITAPTPHSGGPAARGCGSESAGRLRPGADDAPRMSESTPGITGDSDERPWMARLPGLAQARPAAAKPGAGDVQPGADSARSGRWPRSGPGQRASRTEARAGMRGKPGRARGRAIARPEIRPEDAAARSGRLSQARLGRGRASRVRAMASHVRPTVTHRRRSGRRRWPAPGSEAPRRRARSPPGCSKSESTPGTPGAVRSPSQAAHPADSARRCKALRQTGEASGPWSTRPPPCACQRPLETSAAPAPRQAGGPRRSRSGTDARAACPLQMGTTGHKPATAVGSLLRSLRGPAGPRTAVRAPARAAERRVGARRGVIVWCGINCRLYFPPRGACLRLAPLPTQLARIMLRVDSLQSPGAVRSPSLASAAKAQMASSRWRTQQPLK